MNHAYADITIHAKLIARAQARHALDAVMSLVPSEPAHQLLQQARDVLTHEMTAIAQADADEMDVEPEDTAS